MAQGKGAEFQLWSRLWANSCRQASSSVFKLNIGVGERSKPLSSSIWSDRKFTCACILSPVMISSGYLGRKYFWWGRGGTSCICAVLAKWSKSLEFIFTIGGSITPPAERACASETPCKMLRFRSVLTSLRHESKLILGISLTCDFCYITFRRVVSCSCVF